MFPSGRLRLAGSWYTPVDEALVVLELASGEPVERYPLGAFAQGVSLAGKFCLGTTNDGIVGFG